MAQTVYSPNTSGGISTSGNQMVADFQQIAAGAIPSSCFWTAPFACKIQSITYVYGTAAGATSTVGVYKDTGTDAPGAGTITHTAVNMNSTTNTVLTPALAIAATITLAAGDRLSVKVASGSASASALVAIQVNLARV